MAGAQYDHYCSDSYSTRNGTANNPIRGTQSVFRLDLQRKERPPYLYLQRYCRRATLIHCHSMSKRPDAFKRNNGLTVLAASATECERDFWSLIHFPMMLDKRFSKELHVGLLHPLKKILRQWCHQRRAHELRNPPNYRL